MAAPGSFSRCFGGCSLRRTPILAEDALDETQSVIICLMCAAYTVDSEDHFLVRLGCGKELQNLLRIKPLLNYVVVILKASLHQ